MDKRKEKTIEKRVAREREALEKAAKQLAKQVFQCQADAEAAWQQFLKDHSATLHPLSGRILKHETVKRRPGRPRQDAAYPVETTYTVEVFIADPDPATLQELRERESTFVLITTLDPWDWTDADVLQEYKGQEAVERRFRFLRQPVLVDGIYLKSTRRAEALAYVFLLALFVAAFIEMKIRRELKRTQGEVEILGKRMTDRPTIQAVLDLLATIQVIRVDTGQGVTRILPKNTDRRALRILELAGYNASIYTER